MRIYFLRHGEAVANPNILDAERSLTEYGISQAWGVGSMMLNAGIEPEVVFCSPFARAKQTAEIICMALRMREAQVTEFLDPQSDPRQLFTELSSYKADSIMLIGHEPLLSEAISLLISGNRSMKINVAKATLVAVDADASVQNGSGKLEIVMPHRLLEAIRG